MPRTATEWFRMDWQGGAKAKQSQRRIGKAEKDKVKQRHSKEVNSAGMG